MYFEYLQNQIVKKYKYLYSVVYPLKHEWFTVSEYPIKTT